MNRRAGGWGGPPCVLALLAKSWVATRVSNSPLIAPQMLLAPHLRVAYAVRLRMEEKLVLANALEYYSKTPLRHFVLPSVK